MTTRVRGIYRRGEVVCLEEEPKKSPDGRPQELIDLGLSRRASPDFIRLVLNSVALAYDFLTDDHAYSLEDLMPTETWQVWSNDARRLAGSIFAKYVAEGYLPFRLNQRPHGKRGTNYYYYTGPVTFSYP